MAINAVVVWPKREGKRCRQVVFKSGAVNIITGTSGSGKSSLIHIVDYCLGSGKCSIPVGVIRDNVDWFGVLLQFPSHQLLVARRNPEEKDQSGDVYIAEGVAIDVESCTPAKTANVEYLKQKLNEMAGLPNIALEPGSASGFKGPPSFRDMAAFTFQPQHIVANPNTLFFKTDTYEHREKLRSTFPLVLGAVTSEQLAIKHRISQLQVELDRREAILERQRAAANSTTGQLRAYVLKAQELGLLPANLTPEEHANSPDGLLDLLRLVPRRLNEGIQPAVDVGAAEPVLARIRELEEQEDLLSRSLSKLQRRRLQIDRLKSAVSTWTQQVVEQDGRLDGVGWFAKRISSGASCPFCGSVNDAAFVTVGRLQELAQEMAVLSGSAESANPALDKEALRLLSESQVTEQTLDTLRREKWHLEDESAELAERRRTEVEAFRLAGRIDELLEMYEQLSLDSAAVQAADKLRDEIEALKKDTNPAIERVRLSGALSRFSQLASRYIDVLRLERGSDAVELNTDDLMIRVLGPNGRADALWEIGSAENWMGYHLATLLGLHEYFVQQKDSPVPAFLMIDQPSQAYFPDRWPGDESLDGNGESLNLESDDIAGVRRIFETLALAVKRNNGQLQIIVVDHAGDITWNGLANMHLIGNWRIGQDEFLIPREWLEPKSE